MDPKNRLSTNINQQTSVTGVKGSVVVGAGSSFSVEAVATHMTFASSRQPTENKEENSPEVDKADDSQHENPKMCNFL